MEFGVLLLIVIGAAAVGGYIWYASLITRRNRVREALGSVDVQLQQRRDLVPNVLTIAQKFLEHERDLLTGITEARAAAQTPYDPKIPEEVAQHLAAESALQSGLGRLFAVAEAYPDLRSADIMRDAQQTYRDTEAQITAARRFYNSSVADLNNAVEIFPGNMIAGVAGVRPMPFFEVEDEAARAPVDASAYLK